MIKDVAYGLRCWSTAALLLALLLPLSGCKQAAPADAGNKVVAVAAEHPTEGSITEIIHADAVLAPQAQAALQARVTAPVKAFYVERGQKVRAGQVVAVLEHQDLAAAALDTKGSLTAAQGAYTATTQQQVPQEETQARLNLEQAQSTLALAQSVLDARTELFAQGATPGRDVDTAAAAVVQAKAAVSIAQQKLASLRRVGRAALLETAEGQLTSAKGRYLGAEAALGYAVLRTPISGVVTERPLFAGETAAAGSALVTVMDTSILLARLHIPQGQAQQITLNAEAAIAVPGEVEPVHASVALISPAIDPGSTTVEVWLKVANPLGTLKVGTAVHATIQGRTFVRTMLVPKDAVQRSAESGGSMVRVIAADRTAQGRDVTVGIIDGQHAQITDGLIAGDLVITSGGYGLDDGTRVTYSPAGRSEEKPSAGTER